ncbi:MAG: hypothetical protein JXX14_13615 [Deltaproteobacteria bacterium]|nr:hypothetical protein [Deltaproteobacteria bacterium]
MRLLWMMIIATLMLSCGDDSKNETPTDTATDSNADTATDSNGTDAGHSTDGTSGDSTGDTTGDSAVDSSDDSIASDSGDSENGTTQPEDSDDTGNDRDTGFVDTETVTDIEQCADINWTVDLKSVNILVLLDRSASMYDWKMPVDSQTTYASVVQDAIRYIVQQNTEAGTINFALNVFPSAENCTDTYRAEDGAGDTDPVTTKCEAASQYVPGATTVAAAPLVEFGRDSDGELALSADAATQLQSSLEAVGQCGGTPVSASLAWAQDYLTQQQLPPEDTYVILATDGAPNCATSPDVSTCRATSTSITEVYFPQQCLDDDGTYAAAKALRAAGYKTFVIGVGDAAQDDAAIFEEVMDGLAYYGATEAPADTVPAPTSGHYYYSAQNPETLDAALANITNEVIDCEYAVDWASVPTEAGGLPVNKNCSDVRLLGVSAADSTEQEIGYTEDCNGIAEDALAWYWVESPGASLEQMQASGDDYTKCRHIQLCPTACEKMKFGIDQNREWSGVSAKFGCEPLVIPVEVE